MWRTSIDMLDMVGAVWVTLELEHEGFIPYY